MSPFFLPALKAHLERDLADLLLPYRGPLRPFVPPLLPALSKNSESSENPEFPTERPEEEIELCRPVQIFIGDVPPKKRRAGEPDTLDDRFPCIVLVPSSGQRDSGEDVVVVGLVCGIFCAEEGDAEGAEQDHVLLLSRLCQSLYPCLKTGLEQKYRLTEDSKGRLFPWEKPEFQARPYFQSTLMTQWRMKALE